MVSDTSPQTSPKARRHVVTATPVTPRMEDPYAAPIGLRDFRFHGAPQHRAEAVIPPDQAQDARQHVLLEDFTVSFHIAGRRRTLTAPAGMVTDLTSSPRWTHRFVDPVDGPHIAAVILHDYLSIAWQDLERDGQPMKASWRQYLFSNTVMMAALRAARVSRLKRAAFWVAIHLAPSGWIRFYRPNAGPRYVQVIRVEDDAPGADSGDRLDVTRSPASADLLGVGDESPG